MSSPLLPLDVGAQSPASSEPPLFSSDGPLEDADATNYTSLHVKRKRAGPWWAGEAQQTPEPKKTKLTRNFDSGCWIDADWPNGKEEQPAYIDAGLAQDFINGLSAHDGRMLDFENWRIGDFILRHITILNLAIEDPPDPGTEAPGEGHYRSMVPELVLNLGNNNLRYLHPNLFNVEHLTYLSLRKNDIKELPPQIGQLRNLARLDIAHNDLQYYPQELLSLLHPNGKLRIVIEAYNPLLLYSMALNLILALPHFQGFAECLECQNWTDLIKYTWSRANAIGDVEGNWWTWLAKCYESFYKDLDLDAPPPGRGVPLDDRLPASVPEEVLDMDLHVPSRRAPPRESVDKVYKICRTRISYFDELGTPLNGSPPHDLSALELSDVIVRSDYSTVANPMDDEPPTRSGVKSLLVLTIEKALSQETPRKIRKLMEDSVMPASADAALTRAEDNITRVYGPMRKCGICGKPFVVARAEWVEFWFSFRSYYPVKVMSCSWACVPDP